MAHDYLHGEDYQVAIVPSLFSPHVSLSGFWNPGKSGSLYVSGNLPTYPFPKPTWTLYTSYLRQNAGLGKGEVSKFPETYNDPKILGFGIRNPVQGIQNPQTKDPESSSWIQNQEPSIIQSGQTANYSSC